MISVTTVTPVKVIFYLACRGNINLQSFAGSRKHLYTKPYILENLNVQGTHDSSGTDCPLRLKREILIHRCSGFLFDEVNINTSPWM